jgi:hypothetical protein
MNPSIFRPKGLVENSVEKIRRRWAAASLLAPAKNAAPVEMRLIIIVFSIIYEQRPVRFGLKWSSPVRDLKASQRVRVLHKD